MFDKTDMVIKSAFFVDRTFNLHFDLNQASKTSLLDLLIGLVFFFWTGFLEVTVC